MVNLTIDNKKISVSEGTTIMDAALAAGIRIPKLCFLKDINEIAACRVCVVEVEGKNKLITACNNSVEEGMIVYTNSAKVRKNRKTTVKLILSQHDGNCSSCARNQNCELQRLAKQLNIQIIPYNKELETRNWDNQFPLIRDSKRCIKCMRCINFCSKIQGMNIWDVEGTGSHTSVNVAHNQCINDSNCALCGQCITHCPVGALRERDDTTNIWHAIEDPDIVTIVQVAPAVRTAWAEFLGTDDEHSTMEYLIDALRKVGFNYVFDTTFTADLTIMEEGSEFIKRFSEGDTKDMPMFTSCCPGWLRMLKSKYPELVSRLSTAKSPQQMFGAVMKSYFAQKIGIDPNHIFTVSIMPCLAKKDESQMAFEYKDYSGHDVDAVITTRELVRLIENSGIDVFSLEKGKCDNPMSDITGAGVIFGSTGGVMEAALRSAYFLLTGENPDVEAFKDVRSSIDVDGYVEATYKIGDLSISTAVVNGLANAQNLIEKLLNKEVHYDFVEVMACPGGCVGGGGQPIHDGEEYAPKRAPKLYELDRDMPLRFSHENPAVKAIYDDFFEKPNSHLAHEILHTVHHTDHF